MQRIIFKDFQDYLAGKSVAVVGSGPGVLDNIPGHIDGHDVVISVNNYKLGACQGYRTDVMYSFFGSSIRKTADELVADRVRYCICKCPDSQPIESDWHRQNNKMVGVDFTYIYRARQGWWPCPYFVPDDEHFLRGFTLLDRHIPSTGFAAVLDVLECAPASVFLTGFDFFSSGIHNVDEKWRPGDATDPIGHRPDLERAYLRKVLDDADTWKFPIAVDAKLGEALRCLSA